MIIVNGIASSSEQPYPQEPDDRISIDCFQACRNKLAVKSEAGRQLFLDLGKDVYLQHGCCLICEDGKRAIVFRSKEPAFRLDFADASGIENRADTLFALGHQLGNLHLPAEVIDGAIQGPLVTGRDSIVRVANAFLGIFDVSFPETRLGLYRPLFGIRGGHR